MNANQQIEFTFKLAYTTKTKTYKNVLKTYKNIHQRTTP